MLSDAGQERESCCLSKIGDGGMEEKVMKYVYGVRWGKDVHQ